MLQDSVQSSYLPSNLQHVVREADCRTTHFPDLHWQLTKCSARPVESSNLEKGDVIVLGMRGGLCHLSGSQRRRGVEY
jgi:hypothetical protein